MESIFHRRSVRQYTAEPVSDADTELLLRAAMAAPSACNQQPWEFYAVTDPETIRALGSSTPFTRFAAAAPLIIVPCYREETAVPKFCEIDMSAAVENLLLEADHLGLGATWMGIAPMRQRMKKVADMLGIPDTLHVFALVAVGHPAETPAPADRYDPARVHYIRQGGQNT